MISPEALQRLVEAVNQQKGWSSPQLLRDPTTRLSSRFPHEKGLLRIEIQGETTAQVFIGEGDILDRVSALQNVYGEKKPGGTPHTASPHLWERRRLSSTPLQYEVSFMTLGAFSESWRKALACLAITRHRLQFKRSPLANFGAQPRDESLPPLLEELTQDDPLHLWWAGLQWSAWVPVQDLKGYEEQGLYRLRMGNMLLFLGQGKIWDRIRGYRVNPHLLCSYVCNAAWSRRNRLELVNDCVAAFVYSAYALPPAQFTTEAEKKRYQQATPSPDDPSPFPGKDRLSLSLNPLITLLGKTSLRLRCDLTASLLFAC
jgi:hypothetical protein